MTTANDILTLARHYLGSAEGGSNHHYIIDTYNAKKPLPRGYTVKYTDDWCATFVSFVGIEAGVPDLYGRECGVERFIDIFKSKDIWLEDGTITPKPGDIITYNWDTKTQPNNGFADHIGFVESVSRGVITTIEGNKNDSVQRRTISVGAGNIRGYARPNYSGSNPSTPVPGKPVSKPTPKPALKSMAQIVAEVKNGDWGNNPTRASRLTKAGYNAQAIQDVINGKQTAPRPTPKPAQVNGWIAENGKFKLNTAIKLRSGASTSSGVIAVLQAGDVVKYNAFIHSGGYVWIRQPRGNGYGYLATGVSKNGRRQDYWGSFI